MPTVHLSVRLCAADYAVLLAHCGAQGCTLSDGLRQGVRHLAHTLAHTCDAIESAPVGVCPKCFSPMGVTIPGANVREFLLRLLEAGADEKLPEECSTCKRGLVSVKSLAEEFAAQSDLPVDEVVEEIEKIAAENGIELVPL